MALISHQQVADLLIGPSAPTAEKKIINVFEAYDFHPPKDFIITEFDRLVLSQFTLGGRIPTKVPTSEQICESVRNMCTYLDYPSFKIDGDDVQNYFLVLKGRGLGGMSEGKVLSKNFPEVRDRYNALVLVKDIERNKTDIYPESSLTLKRFVAHMISKGLSFDEIKEIDPNKTLDVSIVFDMIIMDLLEVFDNQIIKDTILRAVDMADYGGDKDSYRGEIESGRFLSSPRPQLCRYVYPSIAELWINKNNDDKNLFSPNNLQYVQLALRKYISSGSGEVNRYFNENKQYSKLGLISNRFGSFVVHSVLGIDQDKFSILEFIDKIHDEINI